MSHDPSESIIICCFAAQGTFLIVIIVENIAVCMYILHKSLFDYTILTTLHKKDCSKTLSVVQSLH